MYFYFQAESNFFILFRIVYMTAATVRRVRTVCVLHCLHTYMHVLQEGLLLMAGEMLPAVSCFLLRKA